MKGLRMTPVEQQILDQFQQLDPAAQQRLLRILQESSVMPFDAAQWWAEVERLQASIRARIGEGAVTGALTLLDELREEAS